MVTLKERIIEIKKEHPDWGYKKLAKILNVSRSAIRYHIAPNFKKNCYARITKSRKENPMRKKIIDFHGRCSLSNHKKKFNKIADHRQKTNGNKFKLKELINKIGEIPRCYLTGRKIDINNSSDYSLDHIIPVSKGGDNSLDNCGLTCKRANQAKTDMTPTELLDFCKEVLEYNGYFVTKKDGTP